MMKEFDKCNLAGDIISSASQMNLDADIQIVTTYSNECVCRMGKMETIEQSSSHCLNLRVINDHKQSFITITDLSSLNSTDAIHTLLDRALQMSKVSPQDLYIGLGDNKYKQQNTNSTTDNAHCPLSTARLEEISQTLEDTVLSVKDITNSEGSSTGSSNTQVVYANTQGINDYYNKSSIFYSSQVIAGEGQSMQSDYDSFSATSIDNMPDVKTFALNLANKVIDKLNPIKISTSVLPVILDYRVATSILSAITDACNGGAVAEGRSFLAKDLLQNVMSNNINIIDDPTMPSGLASRPIDGEGMATKKINIISNGVLSNWLLDLYSARKLKMDSNANAYRSTSSIKPSTSNIYLEAGSKSPEELISNIQKGIYVTDIFGFGINTVNGNYSQGAGGFLIENGKKTSTAVNEFTIAGNLKDILQNLQPANDLIFRSSSNSPTVYIGDLTVSSA